MLLTFTDPIFYLENIPPELRRELRKDERWEGPILKTTYRTTDFGAAAEFRDYADPETETRMRGRFVKFYPPLAQPLPRWLDEHQKSGVRWILSRSASYLAHAPGAGKTAQAIVAACMSGARGQVVFIVPPSLTVNWERELAKFTGKLFPGGPGHAQHHWVTTISDTASQDKVDWGALFIICPDSMLTKPWVLHRLTKMSKRLLAVDEASRFKEPTAQRTVALFGGRTGKFQSPGIVRHSKHVVLLDGSPMVNRPIELWAPTFALSPESIGFKSYDDFGFRYCGPKLDAKTGKWEFKYSSNEAELKKKLQATFMHVVPEEALNHPERRRSILFMSEDIRTPRMKAWESRHVGFSSPSEDQSQGDIARHRRLLGERKVSWIARYVGDRLDEKNESILLFAWHREVCEKLAVELTKYKPGLVMGGTKSEAREKYFKEFQAGKRRLIIGNIVAMGRGHNLQRADRVIFGEYSWTDEFNKQCEKRASRRGRNQSNFVRCDYIVCPDSLDERVLKSVFRKEATVKKVIG